ncbi:MULTISPECIES: GNAT family N-acetyltransferase [Photorhabdus]|nr:GNAT family N-acetyltransferase [Photorhabdus asymbiotica]
MNNVTIRTASYEDSAAISDIELQAASLFPDELLPKALCSQTLPVCEIKSSIQEKRLWVAESDQKLVGFALIRSLNQLTLLAEIDVLPEYNGKGIASALLNLIIEKLKQHNKTALYLTTFRDFIPSRRLYDKFGFVVLASDDIPDELQRILAKEAIIGLGTRIAMKLTIKP